MAKTSCEFNTSEQSTKAWFRTKGLIDTFNRILNLNEFRKQNTKWSNYARLKFGTTGNLFLETYGGKKAIPNREVFDKIERRRQEELETTKNIGEEGVSELFESNPELANTVYEALGFDYNEFSLVLKQEKENPEGIMLGEYDIVHKNNIIGNVFLPIGFKNYTIKGISFKEQYLNKGLGKAFYKWLGNKADIENATLNSDFDNTSESAKRVWESLKKENLAIDTQMGYKFSPKNLKQQALQLYSQYLESLNKPNTNPILQGNQTNVEEIITQLEKDGLLEIDCKGKLKAEKGLATSFTKGGKWKLVKDLKDYPTHKEGGVDLTIGKNGVTIKNGNTQFTAKYGLVIPKN